MESYHSIEARALKSSFLSSEMGSGVMNKKGSQQVVPYDDVWGFAGGNSNSNVGGTCDDFPVEELLNLDFNEKEFEGGCIFPRKEDGDDVVEKKISSSTSGVIEDDLSVIGELAVPLDDLENLEWLSQFVDDSTSNLSTLSYPLDSFTKKTGSNTLKWSKTPVQSSQNLHFLLPFPRKPRSKRSRPSGHLWSFSSQVPVITTDSLSSSSSLSSNGGSSTFSMIHDYIDTSGNPHAKKHKRKSESLKIGLASIGRRCTHCQVQKTPQWRTGPLGPKTLCNACGVRYKSGRLFPEYLPACSPLFSQEVHSNSHRKVLELRRKKEMVGSGLAERALAWVVPSC